MLLVTQSREREQLINGNYGLVHSCANRFRGRGVEYEDLFQAGCVGLIKAADNFDSTRGFAFSTDAVPVILGEIKRIFRDGGSVKVGRSMKEKSRKAMQLMRNLAVQLGHEPTVSQLAQELGVDVSEAAQLISVSMPPLSLTGSGDENSDAQLDIPVNAPEEALSELISLDTVLDMLSEKDRKLIELRYFNSLTQSKTAQQLGMSQVQVSRREKSILSFMRKNLI